MSQLPINLSPDLKKLWDDGYHIDVVNNVLLIRDVPYVGADKVVRFGILISELTLAGNVTTRPGTHVAYFCGEHPCDANGAKIKQIEHRSQEKDFGGGLVANHSFSSKPSGGYVDYHHKMSTYFAIISSPAQIVDPEVAARTFDKRIPLKDTAPFHYLDTASSRAEIGAISQKLEIGKVGIVGLGGTGAYVLDLVAKTPVGEIHLFDGDKFFQHNAFRTPGAPSLEVLKNEPFKVEYLEDIYSKMKRNIFVHKYHIDSSNVTQLGAMDFVFLCLDSGRAKIPIVQALEKFNIPFVDTGMGLTLVNDSLFGIIRVTTSTPGFRGHVADNHRIPFAGGADDEYAQNIQIADLNALNATLAVVKWKKLFGFYADLENEHHCTYTLDGNMLNNEDQSCQTV